MLFKKPGQDTCNNNNNNGTNTNEKPTTIGPHVPKMSGPIQFPIKLASRDPAYLPSILTGDILSANINNRKNKSSNTHAKKTFFLADASP